MRWRWKQRDFTFRSRHRHCCLSSLRACLHEGGGPQVGEVTRAGLPHLTCKRDHIKMRDCMDRRVTPPTRVTSPTWGPPPSCKQALRGSLRSDNATATRTSLKKWICVLSVFTAIIPTTYFVKCTRRTLLKLNFKWPYSRSEREIKFRRCLFTSPLKREIRHFHVEVVQKQERNVQKNVMHVQSCCLLIKPFVFFSRSRCRPRRWILKSLISFTINVIIIMNIIFTIITLLSYS